MRYSFQRGQISRSMYLFIIGVVLIMGPVETSIVANFSHGWVHDLFQPFGWNPSRNAIFWISLVTAGGLAFLGGWIAVSNDDHWTSFLGFSVLAIGAGLFCAELITKATTPVLVEVLLIEVIILFGLTAITTFHPETLDSITGQLILGVVVIVASGIALLPVMQYWQPEARLTDIGWGELIVMVITAWYVINQLRKACDDYYTIDRAVDVATMVYLNVVIEVLYAAAKAKSRENRR